MSPLDRLRQVFLSPQASKVWQALTVLSAVVSLGMLVQHFYGLPLTDTIPIGPDRMVEVQKAETGCYRWKVPQRYRNPVVDYRAVVLENGRPFSRCLNKEDVENFKASHFFIRNYIVRFGTDDASDVRSNGKRYELRIPMRVRSEWLIATLALFTLSLTMSVQTKRPDWLARLPDLPDRLPAWVVAVAVILIGATDLVLHADRSFGPMLVKGLPESDAGGWLQLADHLAEGHGLDDAFGAQRPLYAVLLGTLSLVAGHSLFVAKGLSVAFISLAAMGAFMLGRAMRAAWAGLGVAAFLTLDTDHLHLFHITLTETPGLTFGIISAGMLVWALRERSAWGCLLAGIVAGLGNLACGELLLAVPLNVLLILGLGCFKILKPISPVRMAAFFSIGVLAMMLPWMGIQKYRYGIFTLSMNSAELLSGGADPVHGKLDLAMHQEAKAKGLSNGNLAERYRYFSQRFAQDVKADPAGYLTRVAKASIESLRYLRTNDPMLRLLLVLALLGAGLTGTLRWQAAQPLLLSILLLLVLLNEDDALPVAWLMLAILPLFIRPGREFRLLTLGALLCIVIACMTLCGLAGNVASRRFWNVADWALVLLWLSGLACALHHLFALCAKVPWLGWGMHDTVRAPDRPAAHEAMDSSPPLSIGLTVVCAIALSAVLIRHSMGPQPRFSRNAVVATLTTSNTGENESRLVVFDDFVLTLDKGEHISHWLPFYYPADKARWVARPRVIQPDGTLGSRIVMDGPIKLPLPTRWQPVLCIGSASPLLDPLAQNQIPVFHVEEFQPVQLEP